MVKYFNNDTTRKVNIIFSNIFSKIYVSRNANNKNIPFLVPIKYAPSQKFLSRNEFEKDLDNDLKVAVQFPIITYELKEMNFNEDRQLAKNVVLKSCDNAYNYIDNLVIYNYIYELNVFSRTEEDLFQIIEQILPIFNKSITIRTSKLNSLNIEVPLTFKISSVEIDNDYEGNYTDKERSLKASLFFEVPVYLFGGTETRNDIIERVIVDISTDPTFENIDITIDIP